MAVILRIFSEIPLWSVLGLYRVRLPGFVQLFQLEYSVTECKFWNRERMPFVSQLLLVVASIISLDICHIEIGTWLALKWEAGKCHDSNDTMSLPILHLLVPFDSVFLLLNGNTLIIGPSQYMYFILSLMGKELKWHVTKCLKIC